MKFFCFVLFQSKRVLKREGIVMGVEPTASAEPLQDPILLHTDPVPSHLLAAGGGRRRKRRKGGPGLVGEVDWQQGFNFNGMFSRALPFPSWMGE